MDVLLNSGHKMPLIAMGTATYPFPPQEVLDSAFLAAIESGYRHFDTAPLYGSEEAVGRAVKAAVDRGLIKGRDEVFITSKLWCTDAHPDLVLPALNSSLQRMGLDYIDLYLIHWPVRLKPGTTGFEIREGDVLPFDMKGVWGAMEECSRLGLAKSIGVSNFGAKKLSQILQHASIPPAVNQVEMNVCWQQKALRAFCKEKGIEVSAWSPLGANGALWDSLAVMESHVLKDIATSKGKSLPQVALRWLHEQGVTLAIKSFNKERMRQNLQIFDWELSQEELNKIDQIPQRRAFTGEYFIQTDGPIKSLQELWDGEP